MNIPNYINGEYIPNTPEAIRAKIKLLKSALAKQPEGTPQHHRLTNQINQLKKLVP